MRLAVFSATLLFCINILRRKEGIQILYCILTVALLLRQYFIDVGFCSSVYGSLEQRFAYIKLDSSDLGETVECMLMESGASVYRIEKVLQL
jgi:hypothetical protein